jgi:hypothetical protein
VLANTKRTCSIRFLCTDDHEELRWFCQYYVMYSKSAKGSCVLKQALWRLRWLPTVACKGYKFSCWDITRNLFHKNCFIEFFKNWVYCNCMTSTCKIQNFRKIDQRKKVSKNCITNLAPSNEIFADVIKFQLDKITSFCCPILPSLNSCREPP